MQLLRQQGVEAQSAPAKLGVGDLISLVQKARVDVVCISVVAPSTVLHARYLCLKLRELLPRQRIVVGLWGATENVIDAARRVRDSGADEVFTTLAEAVNQLAAFPVEQTAHEVSQTIEAL
jgi:methylmalonyl-CoA mutase cobalamin-binding subunit